MRTTSGLVKDRHVSTVTIFLIVAALVVGIVACDGAGAHTYQLTISSGSGGNVTIPGEGTFPYPGGSVVELVATPDEGYQFGSWSGDVQHIANPSPPSTTIVMNGIYAIVANFQIVGEPGSGHGRSPIAP
jgi:hypothetical protein